MLKSSKKAEKKHGNNLLGQIKKFEQIDEQSNSLIKEISEIKDFFSRNTAELIKHEMSKVLK